MNIEQTVEELRKCQRQTTQIRLKWRVQSLLCDGEIEQITIGDLSSVVTQLGYVMPKAEYCSAVRKPIFKQRKLVLKVIHRMHQPADVETLHIIFNGPVGCATFLVERSYGLVKLTHADLKLATHVLTGQTAVVMGALLYILHSE